MRKSTSAENSVADYLRDLIRSCKSVQLIELQFKAITDLLPILHLLSQFKSLKKLSLHGNRIKELPQDLSKLSKLQDLNISNNLLDDNFQLVLSSLKTLPRLKYLTFQVPPDKQQKVVEEIKTLQYFNNIKIDRKKAKKDFVYNLVNPTTMQKYEEKMCQMYTQLLAYQQKYLNEKSQDDALEKFRQELKITSKDTLERLHRCNDQASYTLEYIMLYMGKYQMFDNLKVKALNICQDIYSDLGQFIFKISQEQDQLFKSMAEKSLNLTSVEYEIKEKQQEQKKKTEDNADYIVLNKNLSMQKQIKRLKKQKEQVMSQMTQVDNLNKKLLDALNKYAKSEKSLNAAIFTPCSASSHLANQRTMRANLDTSSMNSMSRGAPQHSNIRSGQKAPISASKIASLSHPNFQSNSSSSGNRNLTVKQLKDTIDEIYQSKLKFDQKNYDGKIARQTMHQYLFTHLNQKYGLKAAASIVSGIQAYSAQDNDVCVFGKILRNEIDEEFRFVQTELKTTIADLLKMHIKTKMPYKSANEINDMLNQKMLHEISWEQAEDIVKYLYNKHDSNNIILKLDVLFKVNQKQKEDKTTNRRLTRQQQASLQSQRHVRKVKFSLFLKCVLDFQLRNHEKLLKPLVQTFKNRDSDSDGVINEQEFISIIQQLCVEANDIVPYLLNVVDPYETKQITFTQMVRLVANYPESNPILSRFVNKEQNENYLSDNNNQQFSYNN